MRGNQLIRQWKILRLLELRKRGMQAQELAHELEAPPRTIYRDLTALEAAGFPLYSERIDRNSYWRLIEGFSGKLPLPFTATELMALHMSRDVLSVFDGTAFQESIESLFDKVRTHLTPEMIRYLDRISQRVALGFGSVKDSAQVRDIVSRAGEATGRRKCVEIVYRAASTGADTTRKVDPYQVWVMNGGFYLIGLCHLRNAVRTFALERVQRIEMLDEPFHFPESFSLEAYMQTAFRVMQGDPEIVTVRFAPGAARVARERIWHPSQDVREQEDGSVLITLEVPINYEVISWVLGFGAAAEVLEPQSLRKTILHELEAAAARYRAGDARPEPHMVVPEKISAPVS
jgi:predicted DNA-binding transcriptional regulator YafY